MEENLHYSSRSDNKRKFDDQGAPPSPAAPPSGRRPTGFSAPITSHSADSATPTSYNTVNPPPDGIQLAKQRAQEIAARLFSDAEAKRPKVENGDGADDSKDKGFRFDQSAKPTGPMASSQIGMTPPMSFSSYGYPGSSKKIQIPNGRVGVIIGKSGETIKYLQVQSGAKIQVTRDMDADPNSQTRCVELIGTPEQISKAEQLVNDVLIEAEAGGSGSRKLTPTPAGAEHFSMKVPNNKVGLIIGKGGESIRNMQATSGARIQVIPLHLPPGEILTERTVHIEGTKEQIEIAKQLVNDIVLSESRPRNPSTAGGYNSYRSTTNWVPPGAPPVQQPGYGFVQPGAYPSPLQYNMSQQPYGGYPAPAATGWDQSSNPAAQQTTQGSGYDYYSQQQPQQQPPAGVSAPTDSNTYNYNQIPPTYNTQGSYNDPNYSQYTQPGSYAQPISTSQTGYAQQVYGSGTAYTNAPGSTQEGSAPNYAAQGATQQAPPPGQPPATQQGYSSQQSASVAPAPVTQSGYSMPSAQPGYVSQPAGQTGYLQSAPSGQPGGYGQTQGQNPAQTQAVYGQTQPSPTSQAGYTQPAQGYSQPVQGYSQPAPASSGYAPPPSGYASGALPAGYGQQSHVGVPQNQPTGYAQQAYGDSYGGVMNSQPSYSSDGTHGSYDAPSSAQAAPSGVTKASPQA